MENPLPGSAPEGNFSSEPKSEKESALAKTLRRLGIFSERSKEEDDEETEEKPKKFRRFFKGLFKNVVEPPSDSLETPSKRIGFEALFLGAEAKRVVESQTPTPEVVDSTVSEIPTDPDTETDDYSTVVPHETVTYAEAAPEQPEITPDNGQVKEEFAQDVSTLSEQQPHQQHEYQQSFDSNRTVFERDIEPPTEEKEVVIERGAGMALPVVLVGAEYLARKKADKKLEKRVNEKIKLTNNEVDRNADLQRELETLTRHNKEQIETLKRERGIVTIPERSQLAERITARSEQWKENKQSQPRNPDLSPTVTSEKPEERETYKIMEQVAEAAEQNVPVERVFERSHEVKDDQTVPVGASSVGAIMAAQVKNQQLSNNTVAHSQRTDTSSLPVAYDKPGSDMYKQAVQRGFWAAIIIIILGTVAYLLK